MEIEIPYGKDYKIININESFEILLPNKIEIKNENRILKDAIEKPIDM